MSRAALALLAIALAACPSKSDPPAPPPRAKPVPPVADAGVTAITGYDPASGMHLDDDGAARGDPRGQRPRNRAGRPVDILLKSTPTGAVAAVDGQEIGRTPTYWNGEDGREHEFTFVLRNHAVARYRFVPITSGTVHARLEPIAEDAPDGGITPQVAPTFVPDAALAPDARIAPDAAADPLPPEEPRAGPRP